jgi:hypothetical protein
MTVIATRLIIGITAVSRGTLPFAQIAGSCLALAVCVTGLSVGCGAGGVRPRFTPFTESLRDTVAASPDSVVLIAAEILEAEGIAVHHVRRREGYLETHWFDAATTQRASAESVRTESLTIIRLWADAVTERQTLVVAEAARPLFVDPSLPTREKEVAVSEDHPGHAFLQRVFEQVTASPAQRP